jgi:polyhydroxybutyrate depolymerase
MRAAGLPVVIAALAVVMAACVSRPVEPPPAVSPSPQPSPTSAQSVAVPTLAGVCSGPVDASTTIDVPTDAGPRRLIVHRPSSAPAAATLFLALHGYGTTAQEMELGVGLSRTADEHGFIVAYPEGDGDPPTWGVDASTPGFAADVASFGEIVAAFVDGGCVDPARVVLTGFSWGGFMSHTVACHADLALLAIAPVAGSTVEQPCEPASPIPFVSFHGLLDDVVPYDGGPVPFPDGSRPSVLGAVDWAAGWAERNGCAAGPATEPIETGLELLAWSGCQAPVSHYSVQDLDHHWPSQAGDLIWEFVEELPGT